MLQFKLLKKIKNIKTWEVCRQKCQDEDKCDYWQFKVFSQVFFVEAPIQIFNSRIIEKSDQDNAL